MTTDGDTLHFEFSRFILTICGVKFTLYFMAMRQRPDRAMIQMEWVRRVIERPEKEAVQQDGRALRVILLPDGETVHNAFFDRTFEP